jgi:hypothetical protein
MNRQIGYLPKSEPDWEPFEEHTADSKWQYCKCRSCQNKRFLLDSLPGPKINYDKLRLKDEDY